MRHGISMGHTRMKLVAGAVLMCVASVAGAQSATLIGGGATLPALGYGGNVANRLITPTSGSLLYAYSHIAGNTPATYCQTGSGTGKKILAGNDVGVANVAAACDANAVPTGFGGTGLAQPHFVGSDSPLSQADYDAYATGHSTGKPVQLPSVAGAISVIYKKAGVTSLKLTEDQVCRIFSGDIKTWSDSRLAGSGVPSTATGNITVVYRADGSGTSFSLTNHLSGKCGPVSIGGNGVAPLFKTNQSYATAAASYISSYAASTSASGNTGVVGVVGATANDGYIGYAEAANALVAGVKSASVANDNAPSTFVSPTAFGPALPVTLTYDKVIANTVDANGRPTLQSLPLTTQCVALVDPSTYANPTSGYPILAVSYFLGNTNGNGADLAQVRGVLGAPYNATVRASTTTIGANRGLSFLTNTDLTQAKVNGCVLN
ncbi:phosphate ABC transporter substrate-binding protein (PhoT family) [Luteibacter rhizovicinus]|uniref:Phosphate ABC transporter substrate-binding protein (PhoT family) n=1 Tax=Luteibacter rhizovicinus TaxID=242606 RepID=A0A4R3YIA8_9GAMM|nr:substrate-binding domain-containing protein [Luteibacter rhizovicinus]TCV91772.1 phosphate ABC transporter substrate-binding protein (PhoT family) [Luteibacter rhizovicinus]